MKRYDKISAITSDIINEKFTARKFLAERLRTAYKKEGEDHPIYLRERTIIREFIIEQKLVINNDDISEQRI